METIVALNQRLIDHFGLDSISGKPIFRIVWANDEVERRSTNMLDSGVQLLYPIVQTVKKYSYIKDAYVLERLVLVPDFQRAELADIKLSYEPVWVYMDDKRNPLPPTWDPTKLIVDTLYAAMGKKSLAKYKDDSDNPEVKERRISGLQNELFGEESGLYGKTFSGSHEGIVVPSNYGDDK